MTQNEIRRKKLVEQARDLADKLPPEKLEWWELRNFNIGGDSKSVRKAIEAVEAQMRDERKYKSLNNIIFVVFLLVTLLNSALLVVVPRNHEMFNWVITGIFVSVFGTLGALHFVVRKQGSLARISGAEDVLYLFMTHTKPLLHLLYRSPESARAACTERGVQAWLEQLAFEVLVAEKTFAHIRALSNVSVEDVMATADTLIQSRARLEKAWTALERFALTYTLIKREIFADVMRKCEDKIRPAYNLISEDS